MSDLPRVEGMSLDNPHVDKAINAGTTAANCQPRHTRNEIDNGENDSLSSTDDYDVEVDGEGSSVATGNGSSSARKKAERKLRKSEKVAAKKKKQAALAAEQNDPKKIGYVQMAKMGYQELVNAIIRPPRAEYKVSIAYSRVREMVC